MLIIVDIIESRVFGSVEYTEVFTNQSSSFMVYYQYSKYCSVLMCFIKLLRIVPQIEHPLGGSSTKDSHVYFLLIVAKVILL